MTDDRDRRAAAEFRALNLTPLFVEAEVGADFVVDFDRQLAAFRAAARAEGAAEAIGCAVQTLRDRIDVATVAFGEDSDAVRCLTDALARIRALAPAGLVAVSVDRLTELRDCLSELHALVWGECPSLLNEDSGGDSELDLRIRAAVARKEG